jgi:hypothetical protein
MIGKFLLRDSAVVALAAAAWWLLAARSAGAGPVADATGVVAGALVGAVAFLMHEWGHLLAGLASGGRFPVASELRSPFLFEIDRSNSVRQFTVMSLGGFAVTILGILFVYGVLPGELLATRVARGIIVFLAFLTAVLEVPLLVVTIVRGEILEAASVAESKPATPTEASTTAIAASTVVPLGAAAAAELPGRGESAAAGPLGHGGSAAAVAGLPGQSGSAAAAAGLSERS